MSIGLFGVADRYERKLLIFATSVVWLAAMVLIGMLDGETVLVAGTFLADLALGMWLQVAYTYTAEMFPTRARSSRQRLGEALDLKPGDGLARRRPRAPPRLAGRR